MLPPFIASLSGHLHASTPFPTEITTFLDIAQPAIRKLVGINLISVISTSDNMGGLP